LRFFASLRLKKEDLTAKDAPGKILPLTLFGEIAIVPQPVRRIGSIQPTHNTDEGKF